MSVPLFITRPTLAGLILLCACAIARGQPAEGEAESIGFDGTYRPNAWTPVKLRLRPMIGTPAEYKLAIYQSDMDGDRVCYSRPFTLNGNPDGGRVEEKVWAYFIPQPRKLRDARSARECTNLIRIFLCDRSGKQLAQLPIPAGTANLDDIDEPKGALSTRGSRLILLLGDSLSRPLTQGIHGADVPGCLESVTFKRFTLNDLPAHAIGYEGVDAIVWLNADPAQAPPDTMAAIQEYVRGGGRMVVCTNPQNWQKLRDSELNPMLPVTLDGMGTEKNLASLRKLTEHPDLNRESYAPPNVDPWADKQNQDLPIALATAKSGAVVNMTLAGDATSTRPYLARRLYGMGMVVWVAQDFGDPQIVSTSQLRHIGWQEAWSKVFDWRSVSSDQAGHISYKPTSTATDLSRSHLYLMESASSGAALVALAIFFFLGYWFLAGPGSYFYLLSRKQAHASWPAFACCALAATLLTVGVVRLVLHGPPQAHHVSFARVLNATGEALVDCNVGLYIKSSDTRRLSLKQTVPGRASFITNYPAHPDHTDMASGEFLSYLQYEVPIPDALASAEPAIDVTFRSTLKKFRARWTGQVAYGIGGSAGINEEGRLVGKLTNNSGMDLHNVHLVYAPPETADDNLIQLPDPGDGAPAWGREQTLDLTEMLAPDKNLLAFANATALERGQIGWRGPLNAVWMATDRWAGDLLRIDASPYANPDRAFVLLSVFDRLRPYRGIRDNAGASYPRFELLRRTGRHLDASAVLACGHLLILARVDEPRLPIPFMVDGRPVTRGSGRTYYQFIVPLNRSAAAPRTQPANNVERASDN